ncbi:MAG: sigma-70 family RNA polymerase sigma factor [Kofleriaceae bacterium]
MSSTDAAREDSPGGSVEELDDLTRHRLAQLARDHRGFLVGLATKLCRGTFDAEDLAQDVLLKVVHQYDRLPPGTNHAAWMARVMRNLFIDRLRARASRRPAIGLDDVVVAAPPPEEPAWWEELSRDDVRAGTAQLPDELRGAFERFAFDGQSYKEISAALGIPVATVGTRVLRARRRLRVILGGRDDD